MTETGILEREWLMASQVRRALGCSPETLDRLVASRELTPMRLGPHGWRRFARDDVEALIDRYREENDAER